MSVLTRVLTAPCPKTPRRLHFASPVLNTLFTRHFSSFGRFGHDENATFAVQVLSYELLRRFLSILSILFRTTLEHRIYPIRRLLSVVVAPVACFLSLGADTYHVMCVLEVVSGMRKGLLLRPRMACPHPHRRGSGAGGTKSRAVVRDGHGEVSEGVMFMMSTRSVTCVWHQNRDIGI
jgi:hypothetical protein